MRHRRELCPGDNIRNRIETVNSSSHSYRSPMSLSPQQMITESSSFLQLRTRDDNTLLPQETGYYTDHHKQDQYNYGIIHKLQSKFKNCFFGFVTIMTFKHGAPILLTFCTVYNG